MGFYLVCRTTPKAQQKQIIHRLIQKSPNRKAGARRCEKTERVQIGDLTAHGIGKGVQVLRIGVA